ncbi:right-handed parallel beta-helix repeat-containing protein, partial [Bacteroides nordii]
AEGKNVTFWFDAPHIYGVQLNNCENITFENITFDCDPVPFTQGKVIAKNSNSSLLLEPMKGYETLISNPNGTFIIFDPNGDFKLHGHRTCTISQNGDKTLSLTNGNFDIVEVGDYISMPSRTGSMLSLSGCKKIIFNDVRVYASGGMCCVASGGEGGHEFHHFIATRRPGTNRLYAFGADGFHMNELVNGPVIEDSEMSYTADDLINIHGRFGWVCSRNNNSKTHLRILCSAGAIKVGQEIDFWDNVTQQYRGKATVESLTRVSNATEIAEAKKDVIQYLDGSIYDIVLSNEVEADKASLIEHHANVCSGFVVRNCKLHDTFNRGFLINGASDGIIENNIVQNVGSGQSFHMETWIYGEGQYINNLIVRNNTFKKAGALWFSTVPPGGNSFYGAFRSTPMRNI